VRPIKVAARLRQDQSRADLIKTAGNRIAVGTLVEHKSRSLLMTRLDDCSADVTLEAFSRKFRHVPACVRKTLTCDQGKYQGIDPRLSAEGLDLASISQGISTLLHEN